MPWILWSHHFCPLPFIIQAAQRIVVDGRTQVCVSEEGLGKIVSVRRWEWSNGQWGVEWCRISWPWAAWDSTQWILFCFYEQHFFISQWRRLGQIFLTLLGDRIDSWHWLLDMTGCVPKHSSGDKGNAKLVCFYPIGHLFFTAFPCLIF